MNLFTSKRICHLWVAILAWIALVLIFSGFYFALWQRHPDSFIVNKEFNLTPIESLESRLWGKDINSPWSVSGAAQAPFVTELDGLMNTVSELDKTASSIQAAIASLRIAQDSLETGLQKSLDAVSKSIWKNAEQYKLRATEEERKDVLRKAEDLAALERVFDNPSHPFQGVALAEARIALAEANYRAAVKTLEASEYIVKHFAELSDPLTSQQANQARERLQANMKQQNKLAEQLYETRDNGLKKLASWTEERRNRLQWIDFLYFSVGVSTSNTFGDITPNARSARIMTLLQIILGIIIVGYVTSLILPQDK